MTKKQHYVPQFYLRNFTSDDNKLWVFDRIKEEYYFRTPKEVCYEKYLYETLWKDEDPKLGKFILENQIENYFADKEGEYSPLLKRIIDICRNPQNKNALICNHQEKKILASFVANVFVRNPWSLKQIESDLPLEELKKNEEIQAIEQVIQIIGFGDIDSLVKAADKRVWLTEEFDGSRLAPRILEMNYTFLVSNGEPFITSSFPAIYELCDTEERGLMPGKRNLIFRIAGTVSAFFSKCHLLGQQKAGWIRRGHLACVRLQYMIFHNTYFSIWDLPCKSQCSAK